MTKEGTERNDSHRWLGLVDPGGIGAVCYLGGRQAGSIYSFGILTLHLSTKRTRSLSFSISLWASQSEKSTSILSKIVENTRATRIRDIFDRDNDLNEHCIPIEITTCSRVDVEGLHTDCSVDHRILPPSSCIVYIIRGA